MRYAVSMLSMNDNSAHTAQLTQHSSHSAAHTAQLTQHSSHCIDTPHPPTIAPEVRSTTMRFLPLFSPNALGLTLPYFFRPTYKKSAWLR